MVPPEAQRKFAFDGTDLEYIRYLEEHVARLQRQLSNQTSPVQQNWLPRKPQPPSEFVLISSSKFGNQHQNHDKNNNLDLSVQLGPHVNRFLTPIANNDKEWLEKRKRTGINTPSQYLRIFLGLIRTSDLTTSVGTGLGPGTRAKPIDIIRDYCTFASSLQQNAEQETQVSRLATLLFLGICCVSLEVGVDMDTVDNYIKTFLRKPKTSSVYCSRLRKASKWAGQLMEKLEEVLGRRSSELFLLYTWTDGPDIALYQKLSEHSDSAGHIIKKMEGMPAALRQVAVDEPGISFALSFMLAYMGFKLQSVNRALGTNLSQKEYDARSREVQIMTSLDNVSNTSGLKHHEASESALATTSDARKRRRVSEEVTQPSPSPQCPTPPKTRTAEISISPSAQVMQGASKNDYGAGMIQQSEGEVNLMSILLEAAHQTNISDFESQGVQGGQPCLDDDVASHGGQASSESNDEGWMAFIDFNTGGLDDVMVPSQFHRLS